MIKLGIRHEGQATVVLGLSRLNCERLLTGLPITVSMDELRVGHGAILLMAGETEDDITEDLRSIGVLPTDVLRQAHANGGVYVQTEHKARATDQPGE